MLNLSMPRRAYASAALYLVRQDILHISDVLVVFSKFSEKITGYVYFTNWACASSLPVWVENTLFVHDNSTKNLTH